MDEYDSLEDDMIDCYDLDQAEEKFLNTGDGIYAWRAITICGRSRIEYPSWIKNYLGEAAPKIINLDNQQKDFLKNLAAILNLSQLSISKSFKKDRDEDIVNLIKLSIGVGASVTNAIKTVSEMKNLSPETVREIYYNHKAANGR